jgi:hypothetical protein
VYRVSNSGCSKLVSRVYSTDGFGLFGEDIEIVAIFYGLDGHNFDLYRCVDSFVGVLRSIVLLLIVRASRSFRWRHCAILSTTL